VTVSAEEVENAIRVVLNRAPIDKYEIANLQARHEAVADMTIDLMRSHEAHQRIASRVRDTHQSLGDFSAVRTVFMHIPKTAGTTVRRTLRANFPEKLTFPDTNWLGSYPANELSQYRLFMGHFTLHAIQHIPGEKRIFTVLREPRERLLSFVRYKRAMLRNDPRTIDRLSSKVTGTAEAFFADAEVRKSRPVFNVQTRFLCCITPDIAKKFGLSKQAVKAFRFSSDIKLAAEIAKENLQNLAGFGLLEQFDEFMQHVLPTLDLKTPKEIEQSKVKRLNVTQRIGHGGFERGEDVQEPVKPVIASEELQRSLDELVEGDQIVYDFAKELFVKRYPLKSVPPGKLVGQID
jgi:hypothetical protein